MLLLFYQVSYVVHHNIIYLAYDHLKLKFFRVVSINIYIYLMHSILVPISYNINYKYLYNYILLYITQYIIGI